MLRCFEKAPVSDELPLKPLQEVLSDPDVKDILPVCTELDEKESPRTDAEKVQNLLKELCRKGVLFPLGAERSSYVMPHPSIVEYLAARGLANRLERPGPHDPKATWALIDRKAWSLEWEQVVLFLAGTLSNPSPLLTRLSVVKDDYLRHCLALAVRCLGEVARATQDAHPELDNITVSYLDYCESTLVRGHGPPWYARNHLNAMAVVIDSGGLMRHPSFVDSVKKFLTDPWSVRRSRAGIILRILRGRDRAPDVLPTLPDLTTVETEKSTRSLSASTGSVPTEGRADSAVLDIAARLDLLLGEWARVLRRRSEGHRKYAGE